MSTSSLRIYGTPFSVHTRKVILAARLKSIPYDIVPVVPVIPGNPPANWRELSPTGQIPAIDHDGFVLSDSTAIVAYFDQLHPSPRLLPEAPRALGTALSLDAWAGTVLFRGIVHPLFHQQIVAPNIRKEPSDPSVIETVLRSRVPEALDTLEQRAPEAHLVGDALSIADLAVVSNLVMFHYLGHRIDAARHPRTLAYFQRHLRAPVAMATLETERPLVEALPGLSRTFLL